VVGARVPELSPVLPIAAPVASRAADPAASVNAIIRSMAEFPLKQQSLLLTIRLEIAIGYAQRASQGLSSFSFLAKSRF
jgi:hypothetical protein